MLSGRCPWISNSGRGGSNDADRRTDGSTGDEQRALGVVRRGVGVGGLPGLRDIALPIATPNAMNRATRRRR